jgi:hypothetical protein
MDGVIVITPGTLGCAAAGALLGCTAAVGTVGGAKRERDTVPSKLSGTWRRRGMGPA